jgi:hypothetical protein
LLLLLASAAGALLLFVTVATGCCLQNRLNRILQNA